MPCACLLLVTSECLVHILLGKEWGGVAQIFSILAGVALVQPTSSLTGMLMLSLGMGGRYLRVGVVGSVAAAIFFIVGVHWGAKGVALAYLSVTYVTLFPILAWIFKGTPVTLGAFLRECRMPFLVSVAAGLASNITMNLVNTENPAAMLILYCLLYGIFFFLIGSGDARLRNEVVSFTRFLLTRFNLLRK